MGNSKAVSKELYWTGALLLGHFAYILFNILDHVTLYLKKA